MSMIQILDANGEVLTEISDSKMPVVEQKPVNKVDELLEKLDKLTAPANVADLQKKVDELKAQLDAMKPVAKKRRFAGYGKVGVLDTLTGKEYDSQSACARDIDPIRFEKNHFLIYTLIAENPGRFVLAK